MITIPNNTITAIPETEHFNHIPDLVIEPLKGNLKRDWFVNHAYFCLPLTIGNQYGFANDAIRIMFYDWRKKYLEADNVLDKISLYGIESITQQEKDFLETGILNNPYDYYII
jgi:hypothetical protein